MTEEWREVALESIGEVVTGKTPSTERSDYFGGDTPFITPTDMDGRRMISVTERTLTNAGKGAVAKAVIPHGAVLVSCIGSDMGKSAIAGHVSVTNQQINSLIVAPPNSALFVYYNLSSRREEIRGIAAGSAQPILNKSSFSRLRLLLPPPGKQHAIAAVLGALDDKIEQNHRTGLALEELARATFKAWFVDFEPVKAKAAGQTGFPGMPHTIFAAFPDRLTNSPHGSAPQGWEVQPLSKVARFLNGLALQKYPPVGDESDLPVIKIAELRKGSSEGGALANANVSNSYVVNDGDLLFSWSGTLEVELWFGGRGALNQHLFKVTSDRYPRWLCLHWVRQHLPEFRLIASSKATTMGHIKRNHLDAALVVVPDAATLEAADRLIRPLYELHATLALETRMLVSLRDYLLPRLLSGRVRVRQAEAAVEAVA